MRKMGLGRVRIVTDQASLREKIAIFNAGLDDRVIEVLKAIVLRQEQKSNDQEIKGIFFIADEIPRFEIIFEDGPAYTLFTMGYYNALKEIISGKKAFLQDNELYINQDWAHSLLNEG